jgi:hypothetical protein
MWAVCLQIARMTPQRRRWGLCGCTQAMGGPRTCRLSMQHACTSAEGPRTTSGAVQSNRRMAPQRRPQIYNATHASAAAARETVDGWAELPDELFQKVLELLQPAGPSKPQDGGLGFSQALAAVRLVCAGWKAVHDAMVSRLVLSPQTTDELWACWCGGSRRWCRWRSRATDSTRGTSREQHCCTALESLNLWCCRLVRGEGLGTVSGLHALTSLNLAGCWEVTDKGVRAVVSSRADVPPQLLQGDRRGSASTEQPACARPQQLLRGDRRQLACRRSATPPPPLTCTSSSGSCSAAASFLSICCYLVSIPLALSLSTSRGRTAGAATPPAGPRTSRGWLSFRTPETWTPRRLKPLLELCCVDCYSPVVSCSAPRTSPTPACVDVMECARTILESGAGNVMHP